MLRTNPNDRPKILNPHRSFWQNAAALPTVIYSRATIFAPSPDQLKAAIAYFAQNNRPGMTDEEEINRAIYLAMEFDAEAQHLLFDTNPDHSSN